MKKMLSLLILLILVISPAFAQDTVHVSVGWNLVGSMKAGVVPAVLSTTPDSIITSLFFGYDPGVGYHPTETLAIGTGYWVKAKEGGSIVFSSNKSTNHFIGESYGGGIVFYVDPSGDHGLIAAPGDIDTIGTPWHWTQTQYTYVRTAAVADGIGAGKTNTTIVMGVLAPNAFAARQSIAYQGGGYGDWYLPSKSELGLLYLQQNLIGGFASYWYWSSTEIDDRYVWVQNFVDGSQVRSGKNGALRVRPIRSF